MANIKGFVMFIIDTQRHEPLGTIPGNVARTVWGQMRTPVDFSDYHWGDVYQW